MIKIFSIYTRIDLIPISIISFREDKKLSVVMSANLVAEGDQFEWKDLTKAITIITCGQAIHVPDRILYLIEILSIKVSSEAM